MLNHLVQGDLGFHQNAMIDAREGNFSKNYRPKVQLSSSLVEARKPKLNRYGSSSKTIRAAHVFQPRTEPIVRK